MNMLFQLIIKVLIKNRGILPKYKPTHYAARQRLHKDNPFISCQLYKPTKRLGKHPYGEPQLQVRTNVRFKKL